jgi:hypothetical protein
MGSLPRATAGVGSAINDTTRQVGGALGVAVIGSAVTSVYSARILDLTEGFGLNGDQVVLAESSLGGAQRVAGSLGDAAGSFVAAANDGFVDALSIGLRIAAAVIVFAAIVAWRFLPSHAVAPADETAMVAAGAGPDPLPAPVAGD